MDDRSVAQLIKSLSATITELETALEDVNARLLSRKMNHEQCIDALHDATARMDQLRRDYEAKTGLKWVK